MFLSVEKQIYISAFHVPLEWSSTGLGHLMEVFGVGQSTAMRIKK